MLKCKSLAEYLFVCAMGLLLGACTVSSSTRPWSITDLRLLDAPNAPDPAVDLTALYTREVGSDLEVRIDLLDINAENPASTDIYIALDYKPGGSDSLLLSPEPYKTTCVCTLTQSKIMWDLLIVLPVNAPTRVYMAGELQPSNRIQVRSTRDPALDTITVNLSRASLPPFPMPPKVEIFSTVPGQYEPSDRLGPAALDETALQRVPILLTFWNTFDAPTPALALRRWDGAHTGPLGERHGLHHLLAAAETSRIPIALLDIKTPARLAALDTVGGVEYLQRLADQNLLILADTAHGNPALAALGYSRPAGKTFGLPASLAVYTPSNETIPGYRYQFASLSGTTQPAIHNGTIIYPLPLPDEWLQPTPDGPSLELRRALLETAISPDPDDMLILGGELRQSTWGSPDHVGPTLAYFAARPYIRAFAETDLLTISAPILQKVFLPRPVAGRHPIYTSQGMPTGLDADRLSKVLLNRLQEAPSNLITDSAWELYFTLTAPTENQDLAALRSQYLGDVGLLVEAAHWAAAPYSCSDCSTDPDLDGMNECVLASKQYFAILEADGARLVYFFAGIDQLVGPTWQFSAGVSDSRTWNLTQGPAVDPAQIPGAFVDTGNAFELFKPIAHAQNTVIFTSNEHRKTFQLSEKGLEITYGGKVPESTQLVLAVTPQARFQPAWLASYQWTETDGSLRWGLTEGPGLIIQGGGQAESRRFNQDWTQLKFPEDPDFSYSADYTVAFPLAVVKVTTLDQPICLFSKR